MSKRIIIAPDCFGDDRIEFWDGTNLQGTIKMYDFMFWFDRPINDYTGYQERDISNDSSERLTIGDKRYHRAFFIDYVVVRGQLYQAGRLTIIHKEDAFSYNQQVAGDDCGISFGFSIDGNNIVLTATITNTTSDAKLKITTKTIGK